MADPKMKASKLAEAIRLKRHLDETREALKRVNRDALTVSLHCPPPYSGGGAAIVLPLDLEYAKDILVKLVSEAETKLLALGCEPNQ